MVFCMRDNADTGERHTFSQSLRVLYLALRLMKLNPAFFPLIAHMVRAQGVTA